MEEIIEEWRDVVGFEGRYQVSNLGRVRNSRRGSILKNSKGRYAKVSLYDSQIRMTTRNVHILVADAFLGDRPEGKEANHKNGNKQDPRLDNLEYLTKSQNVLHAVHVIKTIATGSRHHWARHPEWIQKRDLVKPERRARGERVNTAKLTAELVRELRSLHASRSISLTEASRRFGVDKSVICDIVKRRSWKHVA